ncbi:uncharacterized protein [Nothobranchius furzeri]|uniref:uncharacterized protein isoform X3 n=1 Tax=Nothobranchius furzeri TaxID=105023 RepID=UPI003904D27B
MYDGRVFFVAQNNGSSSAAPRSCHPAVTQTGQNPRVQNHSNDVIDLCDDDEEPAPSSETSPVSHQGEENVIFVSYIPPKSDSGSRQAGQAAACRFSCQADVPVLRGGGLGQNMSISKVTDVYAPTEINVSSTQSLFSISDLQLDSMVRDTETGRPAAQTLQNSRLSAPHWTSPPAPEPELCPRSDQQLRRIFGITSDVKVFLQKLDESAAERLLEDNRNNRKATKRLKENKTTPEKVTAERMDVHKELDVYIPKAAEVIILPLQNLPKPVLRKMGLADGKASRMSAGSPDVIWICPVVPRRKDQGPASGQGRGSAENTKSLLEAKIQAGLARQQTSFSSSSRAAWEALTNISGAQFSKTPLLRQDSAPLVSQNAVFIHNGLIYLCTRKSSGNHGQPKTRELQTSSRSSELPSGKSKQVQLSDGRAKVNHAAGQIKPNGSTVGSERSSPQPSDNKDEPFVKVLRPEPVSEEAALQPVLVPPQEDQRITTSSYEMHDFGEEDTPGTAWNDPDTQTDGPGADRSVAQTWTRIESSAGSSMLGDLEFTTLENQERVARLKAKLMQDSAAFYSSAMF